MCLKMICLQINKIYLLLLFLAKCTENINLSNLSILANLTILGNLSIPGIISILINLSILSNLCILAQNFWAIRAF